MTDYFKNVPKPEQIICAIQRKDASYVRGVMKFYEKKPPNPFLVSALKKLLSRPVSEWQSTSPS